MACFRSLLIQNPLGTIALGLMLSVGTVFADNGSNVVNEITSLGYGNSPSQAKSDALSRIVQQINQKISFSRCKSKAASQVDCSSLAFYFDFPLRGIIYKPTKANVGEFGQKAILSKMAVVNQFDHQLASLKKQISSSLAQETITQDEMQSLWRARRALIAYSELLKLFGHPVSHSISEQEHQTLKALELAAAQELSDLSELSNYVLQLGEVQKAFIHAPVPEGSVEMTPFSELIRSTLSTQLAKAFPGEKIKKRGVRLQGSKKDKQCYDHVRSIEKNCASGTRIALVKKNENDEKLLLGSYKTIEDGVLLSYELIGTETGLSNTLLLKIPSKLIKNIRTTPINETFDRKLHQNILGDDQFQVQLGSSRGNRNILIFEQEDISLKLKATKAAYFYIVGHVVHTDTQYSYLVELDPSTNTFVGKITPQQINRWIEIGEFSIEPPFGVEHLQLVAANYDLSDNLPATQWDDKLGYHVIRGSENNALSGLQTVRGLQRVCGTATTRGFQRDCSAKITIEKDKPQPAGQEFEHESVLSYTSIALKQI